MTDVVSGTTRSLIVEILSVMIKWLDQAAINFFLMQMGKGGIYVSKHFAYRKCAQMRHGFR